jgi:hypothetical protein
MSKQNCGQVNYLFVKGSGVISPPTKISHWLILLVTGYVKLPHSNPAVANATAQI